MVPERKLRHSLEAWFGSEHRKASLLMSHTISGYGTFCLFIPLPHNTPFLLKDFRTDLRCQGL